jgi:hypothetical protein
MSDISLLPGALQSATTTIKRAVSATERDAAIVARAQLQSTGQGGATPVPLDVVSALIDARQQLLYTQAGARMISISDEMMGSLLDTQA